MYNLTMDPNKTTLSGPEDNHAQTEPLNILLVDDLPEKLVVYQSILEELGQNLIMARSGEEALKLVLQHEFAVILLDVNMPGMDGFETATFIRNRKKSASTPIIFLTAFTDEVQVAQGYASGAVDYLPTPVVPEILKAKVRVFIELSQMRRQAALQAEERARRTAAEEADRRKDEFLGMLAHELRNPLGPIKNAVRLMHLVKPDDPRWGQLHDMIDRQVTHIVRLIDDLLDSTRIARGLILLRKERCNLTQIVHDTAQDYATIFEEEGMMLEIHLPPKPIWLEGDSTRLTQAIGNLLHNAHKFNHPGGQVKITLTYNEKDHEAIIAVQDTGVGIEPHILPTVFEAFRQADQGLDRHRGGLGLGLALVKGLAELHDGQVTAHSDGLDKGAKFSIYLPITPQLPDVSSEKVDSLFLKDKKCRIVIIEDNQDVADSLKMLLDIEGYEVEMAHNGAQGVELIRLFQPAVVICDIGLSGMNGYQVAQALRQENLPISPYLIALTGYGREQDKDHAQKAGFDLHLIKPLNYEKLRHALSTFSLEMLNTA